MAIPLILLAIGSIGAGYVGVPHVLGGSNAIESFLEPSFEASHAAPSRVAGVAGETALQPVAAQGEPRPGEPAAEPQEHAAAADEATEKVLMGVSIGVAAAGIFLAFFFWQWNRKLTDSLASSFAPVRTLLLNKYYVDELYNSAIVQPIKLLSSGALWKGVDAGLIDGTVNGVGSLVRVGSTRLRRLQTGSIRTYAASLFLGVALILGWYLRPW
jgi:NADH-quinone oxidoreductase subunit L